MYLEEGHADWPAVRSTIIVAEFTGATGSGARYRKGGEKLANEDFPINLMEVLIGGGH